MRHWIRGAIAVIALSFPIMALSQTVVGRAIIGGRVALLNDNGTWSYEDAATPTDANCKVVTAQVQFCGRAAGWIESTPASPEINMALRIDALHYAQYLIEAVGTDNGLNAAFMRTSVLGNAKAFTGQDAEVIDIQSATLGDLTGETIVYRVAVNGVDIVFANSIFLTPNQSMQIMTYALSTAYTPEHAALQADLLSFTKIAP